MNTGYLSFGLLYYLWETNVALFSIKADLSQIILNHLIITYVMSLLSRLATDLNLALLLLDEFLKSILKTSQVTLVLLFLLTFGQINPKKQGLTSQVLIIKKISN